MRWERLKNPAFLACLVVLVLSGVSLNAAVAFFRLHLKKEAIYAPDNRQVSAIPTETRSWKRLGRDRVDTEAIVEELGTTDYLNRTYVQKDPPRGRTPWVLDLHLAYYTGMIDTVPHVPERCMVGGGWQIAASPGAVPLNLDRSGWVPESVYTTDPALKGVIEGVYRARLPNDPRYTDRPGAGVRMPREGRQPLALRVTEFRDPSSGATLYAGYFFIANGGVALTAEDVRLLAFRLHTRYAYYLKVQISSPQVKSAQELADASSSLLGELLPEIMRCVPDWVDVQRGLYPPQQKAATGT